jgi:hypothetical protein
MKNDQNEKAYKVEILIVPSKLESMLTGVQPHYETVTVYGKTRAEAIKKAGIK